MRHEYIDTEWELASYDVWGNTKDGYEVNDVYRFDANYPIRLKVKLNNAGTEHEFKSAHPSDKQIREALNIKPRVHIDTDGDDLMIYVNHASTGYPLGQLFCISHKSLSPIEKA